MKCGQFLKFPTHGLLSNLLFQYFYRILDSVNKGVVDQFFREEIMSQSFEVASFHIGNMTKVNNAWYTHEDQVSPFFLA